MDTDEHNIHAAHTNWIEAVNAGDLARLLTLITDDVVFLNPGHAPFGREKFQQNFSAAKQQIHFHCVSDLVETAVWGDAAFTRSRDSLKVSPRAGGDTTRFAGDRMTIYRRQPDGRWLLARDAHTLTVVKS